MSVGCKWLAVSGSSGILLTQVVTFRQMFILISYPMITNCVTDTSFCIIGPKKIKSLFSRAAANFNHKFDIALVAPELFLFSWCKNCTWGISDKYLPLNKISNNFSKSILIFTWDKAWVFKNKPCFDSNFHILFTFMILHLQDINANIFTRI